MAGKKVAAAPGFPEALAKLLKERKLKVPAGLTSAPPEAYAHQPAAYVQQLAKLSDEALAAQAARVAGYAAKQAARAKDAWDRSPLIVEMKRRKLKVPPRPAKVVGAAFSLKTPLREWTDEQLVEVAKEWARRGSTPSTGAKKS
ncbi:MAG TPA: hypothetical protein VNE62_05530 [Actinomycetota bacterium]|nr:hypothetical protein [Actinomycetota bacterium]